jgi:hypothetical protein
MKTKDGDDTFANFLIGNSRSKAKAIFNSLKGRSTVKDSDLLQLEFMETRDGIPINLEVISCNLHELGENCKIITKELFKSVVLE